jgi:Tol biopolymer transport system component
MKPGRLPILFLVALLVFLLSSASTAQSPGPLADTPWPMVQHDPQHTGRSPFLGPLHSPELLWTEDISTCIGESGGGVIALNGDLIYSLGGCLHRFDPIERELKWKFLGDSSRSIPLLAADSSLYWGFGQIFSRFLPDGTAKWIAILDDNHIFGSSPTFGPDGNLYVDHDALWSFSPDGEMRWYIPATWFSHLSPVFDYAGGLYWNWCKYKLVGDLVGQDWCVPPSYLNQGEMSIGADGTIYVTDLENNGKLAAINPGGDLRWEFDPESLLNGSFDGISDPSATSYYSIGSPAISPDGTIYYDINNAGSPNPINSLLAIHPDGKLKWMRKFSANPITTFEATFKAPLTVDRDGNVFFCTENSRCYGINPDNEILWEFEFPLVNSIQRAAVVQPLITADGLLYLVDNLGRLYALADPLLFPILRSPLYLPTFQLEPGHSVITTTISVSSTVSPISYTVNISNTNWLSIDSTTGQTPSELQLSIDPTGLPVGTYRGSIQFKANHVVNQEFDLPVALVLGKKPVFLPIVLDADPDRISYTSNWFHEVQIASILPNGKDRIVRMRLTPTQIDNLYFSPSGNTVAIYVYENNQHIIRVYNVLNGQLLLEIKNANISGSQIWSPDSRQFLYLSVPEGKSYSEVFRVNSDGTGLVQLTDGQLGFAAIHWSPDGSKIAIQAGWNKTYFMNADGSQLYDFFPDGSYNIPLSWSPNSRYLLTMNAIGSSPWVWVNDLQTKTSWRLTDKVNNLYNISWSPDSTRLAFIGLGNGDRDIYLIDRNGGETTNLTASNLPEGQIAWSPDGNWILYTAQTQEQLFANNYDLYIVHPDGSDRQKITANVGDDMNPFWVR